MLLTPHWLYYLAGSLMFAMAAFAVLLMVRGLVERRRAGLGVELSHGLMGVAMAGMFVNRWVFGPNLLWELIFAGFVVWFVARAIQSIQRSGPHFPHTLIHALMGVAMLLMYWFPASGGSGGMSMGGGMASSQAAGQADAGLLFVLAVALFASAIFTLASPRKGWVVFGSGPALATADDPELPAADKVAALVTRPRLVDVSHATMCVAMGFMLILMM